MADYIDTERYYLPDGRRFDAVFYQTRKGTVTTNFLTLEGVDMGSRYATGESLQTTYFQVRSGTDLGKLFFGDPSMWGQVTGGHAENTYFGSYQFTATCTLLGRGSGSYDIIGWTSTNDGITSQKTTVSGNVVTTVLNCSMSRSTAEFRFRWRDTVAGVDYVSDPVVVTKFFQSMCSCDADYCDCGDGGGDCACDGGGDCGSDCSSCDSCDMGGDVCDSGGGSCDSCDSGGDCDSDCDCSGDVDGCD